ncbi:MAG: tail fiber domain-containing protein [Cetobacterium sp.]|uniref:tail fiber domain-containing protein n=1 Tax=Cetobacterium sp. TaxID=2071632 RepID=UPI003EE71ACE
MGKLFGGGGSQSTTTETSPWKPAQGALENILNQAGNLFDQQGGINAEWVDKQIADLTPEMQETVKNLINSQGFKDLATNIGNATQQGVSGIGQATGILGGLANQGITAENINKMAGELYDSELVQSQKTNLGKDIEKGLAKSTQGINQAASGSGNMGSSRAGVAEGVAIGEAADAYATGASAIENSARTQALQGAMGTLMGNQSTALGAAGQLGSLGLGSVNAQSNLGGMYQQMLQNQLTGSGILQNQNQNILNNQWFNQQGQQNMGWNQLNNYLNIAGSIGGMGGTSTSTGPKPDRFGQMLGAGATLGGAWLMSDERLKDNIELVERVRSVENKDGVVFQLPNLYTWTWNDKAKAFFEEQGFSDVPYSLGVVAQDLEEMGMGAFVEKVPTEVEGLDGEVRLVNYGALIVYAQQQGLIQKDVEA